jgi:hypothetical protein
MARTLASVGCLLMAKLVAGGVKLRSQIDAKWPKRDRRSDGWIGDSAHSKRKSDHNPDKNGWVHALDIDENMGMRGVWRNGRTARRLANQLRLYAASDLPGSDRLKYLVYEGRLSSGTYRSTWWNWRSGNWGHYQHIHVSFTAKAQEDRRVWPLPVLATSREQRKKWTADLERGSARYLHGTRVP